MKLTRPEDVEEYDAMVARIEQLEQQLATARNDIRNYVKQLDDMYGTPCEQIRHKQEVERLRGALDQCDEYVPDDIMFGIKKALNDT